MLIRLDANLKSKFYRQLIIFLIPLCIEGDECSEKGNYMSPLTDKFELSGVNGPECCQKQCQAVEESKCKFWSYNAATKYCYRLTGNAATGTPTKGNCKITGEESKCTRGPRLCDGKEIIGDPCSEGSNDGEFFSH